MSSFRVEGGHLLSGEIVPQGAKNEALQIISAVLLTDQEVIINKIPQIRDVLKLIDLLQDLGVEVSKTGDESYSFKAANVDLDFLDTDDFKRKASALRGSIMILGPLLARFGTGKMPKPGGDKIGRRRLDTHFVGFQNLGAKFNYDSKTSFYTVDGRNLKGAYMLLDEASVTGTANIIMAAVMAEGLTTIYNAACEPYIQQLCKMLVQMGARIEGIGSNLLTIHGVQELQGTTHTLMPDMIEVGSFIGLAAMTQADLTIKNAYSEQLAPIIERFKRLGVHVVTSQNDLIIRPQEYYEIEKDLDGSLLTLADAVWPGFPPDLLSVVLVVATQARGHVLIHQKMFESRLFFVDKLIEMGAQLVLCDPHRAAVIGLDRSYPLRGIRMASPDIRAGIALLIAALSAQGTSIIENIDQIDRGYESIDVRLNALGAAIERID